MADYSDLKQAIRDTIYDNEDQDITGAKLQGILLEMVDDLGQSYVKPATGIPASDMAQTVQESLAAASSAYQLPNTGIPSSDLAVAVRASLALADTAVQPADLPAPEFFWATYGTTTFAEVTAARAAGKVCIVPYDGGIFVLGRSVGESTGDPVTEYFFTSIEANASKRVSLKNTNAWSYSVFYLELTACKVQTIAGHESSTTDYPSTKAVAEALATKQGTLTFDDAPTANSNNPVKSGGIKTAIDAKYTKPSGGIPASDLASGVIPTVPTDVVKYSSQSLTTEQQAQARTNIGAGTYSKPNGGIPASDMANDSMFVRGNRAIWSGTSVTAAGTAAKTASVSNFLASDLAVGVMVVVTFSNTNTAAPNNLTLNIAARGAKPIKRWVNGGLADIDKPENLTGTMAFVYDGTNWVTWYESFDDVDGNCLDAKFGNVTLHQWKPDYTMTDGSYVKGADGLLYEYSGSKYVEVAVGDAERVRFLGIYPKYSSWTNGFAFGKYVNDQWVTIESEKFDYDTSQDASITKEYIRAVPPGATHFRTSSASSSLLALEREFYLYFQTGKPAVSQEELEAAVNPAIIYTSLGEPDWEEYDYDTSAYLTTLRTTGYYSFTMDEEYVFYVTVQAIEMGDYTYVYQQYWGSEEGLGSVYYRGFVYDNENDEIVSDNDMSYMTLQQASSQFANKNHVHYTNVRDTVSIWSYCDTMQTLDATSEVIYTDSTTSTQWLIEGAYSIYQPAVRYQKVTPLQGGTCYYQRSGTVAGSVVTWGAWYRFDATLPIATTQPQGGFLPNIVYDLGVLTGAVTFALATPTDASIPNPYHFTFETGNTVPNVSWPANIVWLDGSEPAINANKHYEILIRNGYGTALIFDISGNR